MYKWQVFNKIELNVLYYMFGLKTPWFIKQIKTVILFLPKKIYIL